MEHPIQYAPDLLLPFDVVAIAASYGGIEAIKAIVSSLPKDFPAPIVFLQHIGDEFPDSLPQSIGRCAGFPVKWAEQGGTDARRPPVYCAARFASRGR